MTTCAGTTDFWSVTLSATGAILSAQQDRLLGRLAIVVVEQFRGSFDGPRRTVSQLRVSPWAQDQYVHSPSRRSIWCAANTSVTEADPAARGFAQIPQTAVGTTRVSRTSDLGLRRRQTKVTLHREVHRTTTWSRPLAGPLVQHYAQ